MVRIPEVDVTHVYFVVNKIGIECIVVPEVVLIVFSFPMTLHHEVHELGHSVGYIGPERRSKKVEVRVDWAHHFVIWVR